MKWRRIAAAVLLLQGVWASLAWSALQISPQFSLRQEYNDNIFLERDKEEDFITFVRPSFQLLWETRLFDLDLDLGVEYEKYARNSDEDDLRPSQGSRLESLFNVYRDIAFLRISDTYERVPIDEGEKGAVGNNLVNLTDSNRLEINPYLQFEPLSSLQVRFDYLYLNQWYSEEEGDDADTHRYSLTLTQQLGGRLAADLSGSYSRYRPRDARNALSSPLVETLGEEAYDRRDLQLGFSWQLTDRLFARVFGGRSWLDYDFTSDYAANLYGAQLDYELSRTLTCGLSYREDVSASVEEGARQRREEALYLSYSDRARWMLQLFRHRDDYLELNRRDDAIGVSFSGDVPLTLKQGVTWQLELTDYEEGDLETYLRYGARLELYHQLRLGRLSLGYTFNRNDSDLREQDYDNNIAYLQLALRW
ncbi:TIGR03016 family PEP-CTERM system-associated outer membrane protein [Desulfuromonas thiophila]|uniref:TIGR03016 family PEP-CTERM system-associated outer membrane protein n=1 Tax=Desulfuromonas thiophila TaxID=57664 RepID=UPI0024A805AC|nr:TIGR03016 family PEP-CTERM system-associated outer membrane protein [Desulfuromonas thiophila]